VKLRLAKGSRFDWRCLSLVSNSGLWELSLWLQPRLWQWEWSREEPGCVDLWLGPISLERRPTDAEIDRFLAAR
jgi:hypothetical protein